MNHEEPMVGRWEGPKPEAQTTSTRCQEPPNHLHTDLGAIHVHAYSGFMLASQETGKGVVAIIADRESAYLLSSGTPCLSERESECQKLCFSTHRRPARHPRGCASSPPGRDLIRSGGRGSACCGSVDGMGKAKSRDGWGQLGGSTGERSHRSHPSGLHQELVGTRPGGSKLGIIQDI